MLRVYERLTAERLLEMRHGEGTFVAVRMPPRQLSGQRVKFMEELTQLIRQGRLLGIEDSGLHALLDDILASPLMAEESGGEDACSNHTSGET